MKADCDGRSSKNMYILQSTCWTMKLKITDAYVLRCAGLGWAVCARSMNARHSLLGCTVVTNSVELRPSCCCSWRSAKQPQCPSLNSCSRQYSEPICFTGDCTQNPPFTANGTQMVHCFVGPEAVAHVHHPPFLVVPHDYVVF